MLMVENTATGATAERTTGRFVGKIVLISGGADGIGGAAARAFAAEGAKVAILDIAEAAGARTLQAIRTAGGQAEFFCADLSQTEAIDDVIDRVIDRMGPIDVFFNHAGTAIVAPFDETTLEDFESVVNLNIRGSFVACQRMVREMLRTGGGAIVLSSSIGATQAFPLESIYCMSKAAISMLAKSIAVEYRERNIRANAVCPGFVRTGHGLREIEAFQSLGADWSDAALGAAQVRMCEPEEVARAVLFLASDEASFVNGAALYVDNGWSAKG